MAESGPRQQGNGGSPGLTGSKPSGLPAPCAQLATAARTKARGIALRNGGKTLLYERLAANTAAAARALANLESGPCLALLLPSGPALVTYTLAALQAGLTPIILDPNSGSVPHFPSPNLYGARVLITTDLKPILGQAVNLAQSGLIDRVVVVPHTSQLAIGAAFRLRLFSANRLGRVPPALSAAVIRECDLLAATPRENPSNPKPAHAPELANGIAFAATVPLTHQALAANLAQLIPALPPLAQGGERILAAIPLTAPLAFNTITGLALAHAAELVIPQALTPHALALALIRCQPTVIVAAPALLAEALSDPAFRHVALHKLKFTLTLGPRAPQRTTALIAAAAKAPLLQSYSLEDAAVIVALAEPQQTPSSEAAAPTAVLSYTPLAGTRFTVRDLAGPAREIPSGERGALYVSGPQFAPQSLDQAGCLRTGDVGLIDATGRIRVIDHSTDLIVASGYMIYPSRIEDALTEHPGVTTAAVIGVSDGRRGNAPKAFVVLKRGLAITERDLRTHLASRISKIEMPADIDFCPRLPLTPFGTVDKDALRREEAARRR